MRVVSIEQLQWVLASLPENPRVVASGNFATPQVLLNALDAVVPEYRLHMLNAQKPLPDREGVTYETAFVGPAMRNHERLVYIPCRLSLVPVLFRDHYRPDVVLLHTSARRHDTVSLGTEVNILPAAIESVRERGGLVIVQSNPNMPYTYGDAQIYENEIDYLVEVDEPLPDPLAEGARRRLAADRRADRRPSVGRVHPSAGDRRGARCRAQLADPAQGPAHLDRDVQRRRARAVQARRPRPRGAAHGLVHLRLAGAVRVDPPQQVDPHAADRAHQRSRPDRPAGAA